MRTEQSGRVPLVQVQVVTYNSADRIMQCLDSIVSQNFHIHRILVIDNGSTDDTVERVQQGFPLIPVVCMDKNTGYAGGHNVGFNLAHGESLDYVLTVNPDVILDSYYVKHLVDLMETNGIVGGATGKLLRVGDGRSGNNLLDSTGLYVDYFYHAHDRGGGQVDNGQYDETGNVWGICGAAALYRVSMLTDLASDGRAFDEVFFLYKEDVDLCWQARRRGWLFWYVPAATCDHHRTWKRGAQMSDVATAYSYSNQIAILIRHAVGPNIRLVLTLLVEVARLMLLMMRRVYVARQALRLVRKSWSYHWSRRRQFQIADFTGERSEYGIHYSGHV